MTDVKHFLRCKGCLQRVYVEAPKSAEQMLMRSKCDACGWNVRHEGILNNGRVVREYDATPCDERCTEALGTKCTCLCDGKNHGTGATVTYRIDGDSAFVRTIPSADAVRIAAEYGAARKALLATVGTIQSQIDARVWVDRGDFDKVRAVQDRLTKASKSVTHKKRMEILG